MSDKVQIYDTTLRDGAQMEGITLSLDDKLKITKLLDDLGVDFIEGGWPGANQKDSDYFKKVKDIDLKHAKIVAFGSTRRANGKVSSDPVLQALINAKTDYITIVGKSWDMHVDVALSTTNKENLAMIYESIDYLKSLNKKVFLDAEHFFDGFKANPEYTFEVIDSAIKAGVDGIVLCDTNGGSLPNDVKNIVSKVVEKTKSKTRIGIHVHNDGELAVANSLAAFEAGATQIQGTINGIGERCGNANLISIIPNLYFKYNEKIVPDECIKILTPTSRQISDILNMNPDEHQPFVGFSAFAHKGGLHASAVVKDSKTYEHIKPEDIGNSNKILISDQAGISNIIETCRRQNIDLGDTPKETAKKLLGKIKELESKGYQFEDSGASFTILLLDLLNKKPKFFDLIDYRVLVNSKELSEATVRVKVKGESMHTASLGVGPADALDNALRKSLNRYYPEIKDFKLVDFKVRIVDGHAGSAAKTRVHVESSNGKTNWITVGLSTNILDATWIAITEGIEYGLWLSQETVTAIPSHSLHS